MIVTLRHYLIDSWFGRVMAGAIFLAFVAWGSETFLFSAGSDGNSIIQVGDESVTQQKFAEAVGTELQWIQSQGGEKALDQFKDTSNLDALGQGALHNLAMAMSLGQYENSVNFKVPDQVVRDRVFSDSQFQNSSGSFDQKKMDDLLAANQLTRDDLISRTRVAAQVQAGLIGIGTSAEYYTPLLKQIVKYSTQSYPTTIYHVMPTPGKDLSGHGLSVADEKRYFENHQDMFTSPEVRDVHVLALVSAQAMKSSKVSDQVLQNLYNERKREFDLPERRDVSIITAPDAELAKQARGEILKGKSPADVANSNPKLVPAALTDMRKADFPDTQLAKLVFAQAVGTPSQVTQTASGWVVAVVKTIRKPELKSFQSVKSQLQAEVLKYQGPQILVEQRKKLQDLIAKSSSLEGLKVDPIVTTWKGRLESGDLFPAQLPKVILDDISLRESILKAVDTTQAGSPPSLIILENGDSYAVTVDHVTPAGKLTFEKAQPSVAIAMLDEQKHKAVEAVAASILAQARAGKSVSAQGNAQTRISHWRGDLSRSRQVPAGITQQIQAKVLMAAEDPEAPASVMLADGNGFLVAIFDNPVEASESQQETAIKQLGQQLSASLKSDISETLGSGYISTVKLKKFNKTLFKEVLSRAVKG